MPSARNYDYDKSIINKTEKLSYSAVKLQFANSIFFPNNLKSSHFKIFFFTFPPKKRHMGNEKTTYTQEQLNQIIAERDFYKKILEKIPAVIHINNLETEVVEWINDAAEKDSGYKKSEIINNPDFLSKTVVDEDQHWIDNSIYSFKANNDVYSYIYSLRSKKNEINTYHGFVVTFENDIHGRPLKNLCIEINITHEVGNYKNLKTQYETLTQKFNKSKLELITKIEKQILINICKGLTINEIAVVMNRSPHTIDNHKRNIFRKLNINKTRHLTSWAKEVGLF